MLTVENCSNDPFTIAYAFIAIKTTLYTLNSSSRKKNIRVTYNTQHIQIHRTCVCVFDWCSLLLKFCLSCHINFCISSNFMLYQVILAFHYNPCVCVYMWAECTTHHIEESLSISNGYEIQTFLNRWLLNAKKRENVRPLPTNSNI